MNKFCDRHRTILSDSLIIIILFYQSFDNFFHRQKNFKFVGSNLKITNSILDSFFDGDIMRKNLNINNSKKISKSINKILIFFKN